MKTSVMRVTPELAAQWLKHNTNNRPVTTQRVNAYADDIRNGRWQLTHQGVAICEDGNIADGQHRLMAIVKADTAVNILVTLGMPRDAIAGVDQGLSRSISDVMIMSGSNEWVNPRIVSALKYVYESHRGRSRATVGVLAKAADEVKDSLQFADKVFGPSITGITKAPVVAAVALIHSYGVDEGKLTEFVSKLRNGVVNGERDSSIVRLREYLTTNTGSNQAVANVAIAKTQRAFQLFSAGLPAKKLLAPAELPYPRKKLKD